MKREKREKKIPSSILSFLHILRRFLFLWGFLMSFFGLLMVRFMLINAVML